MQNLKQILKQFSKKRIGVLGDLMLDEYILGQVERISPEAPCLLVLEKESD